jgi:hypothetical protein
MLFVELLVLNPIWRFGFLKNIGFGFASPIFGFKGQKFPISGLHRFSKNEIVFENPTYLYKN